MAKEKWVSVCPKCRSREVTKLAGIAILDGTPKSACLSCGYASALFPEVKYSQAMKLPARKRNFTPTNVPVLLTENVSKEDQKANIAIYKMILIAIVIVVAITIIVFVRQTP